jgi:hypothetical protein
MEPRWGDEIVLTLCGGCRYVNGISITLRNFDGRRPNLLEAVAKVVTNACSLRDIDQIQRPDRAAVRGQ